jgi:mannose-6-phosphate isomerase-like protein (cupin superfamily)
VIFAHRLPSTRNDNRNIVPAAFAPEATPTPGIGGVPLFDVTVPEDQFPHGGNRGAVLFPVTVGTGAVGRWTSNEEARDPGVRLVYVLSGSLVVRTGGAGDSGQLVTVGGKTEAIPAGGEFELRPGDAWVTRLETEFNFDNTGNQPVELLVWILTDQPMLIPPMPADWEYPPAYTGDAISPEPGPATLQMFLVSLAAGDVVPSPKAGEYHFSVVLPFNAAGTPTTSVIALTHDDGIQNLGKEPIQIYVLAMIPEDAPASRLETEIRQP